MNFRTYGALKAMVDAHNRVHRSERLELWHPHMFADGKWEVDLKFGDWPELKPIAPFLSFCLANNLYAFFFSIKDDVYLHIQ